MGTQDHTRPTRTGSGSRGLTAVAGPPLRTRSWSRLGSRSIAGLIVAAALLILLGLSQTIALLPQTVAVTVDGLSYRFATSQRQVGAFLSELGIAARDIRSVTPGPDAPLTADTAITVVRERPVVITDGGRELAYNGDGLTLRDALDGVGVTLDQRDALRIGAREVPPDTRLSLLRNDIPADAALYASAAPLLVHSSRITDPAKPFAPLAPVPVTVERAVPVVLHERGQALELRLRGDTLRAALAAAGAPILSADRVLPDPDGPVTAGMNVFIQRARGLTLTVDRQPVEVRSRAATVADLLAERGIKLEGLDRVEPSLITPLRDGARVTVVRVREVEQVEEEILPVVAQHIPDESLDFGATVVKVNGSEGLRRHYYRVRYEDGEEVARELVATRLEREPINRVVHYGTKAPTVQTPDGPMTYTRKLRVWATWYDASHGGKPRSSPAYGLTALGMRAVKGIMAVDPRVIPFYTRAYVPGYGIATAADTGGGIKGNMIDLAFSEDEPKTWTSRYTDIYLLGTPTQADAYRAAFGDE